MIHSTLIQLQFQIFRSCMYKMWKLKVEIESMLEFDVIKSL